MQQSMESPASHKNKYVLIYLKKQLKDNKVERDMCKKHKEEEKIVLQSRGMQKTYL